MFKKGVVLMLIFSLVGILAYCGDDIARPSASLDIPKSMAAFNSAVANNDCAKAKQLYKKLKANESSLNETQKKDFQTYGSELHKCKLAKANSIIDDVEASLTSGKLKNNCIEQQKQIASVKQMGINDSSLNKRIADTEKKITALCKANESKSSESGFSLDWPATSHRK